MTEQRNDPISYGSTTDPLTHPLTTDRPAVYEPGPYQPAPNESEGSLTETARDKSGSLKDTVIEKAGEQAGPPVEEARRQASRIAQDAGDHVSTITGRAKEDLGSELGRRQQQLAGQLRNAGEQLEFMAQQRTADGQGLDGMVAELIRGAGSMARQTGDWLDSRAPGDVLDSARDFARRRPGAFLTVAAATGLVLGRITRGMTANRTSNGSAPARPAEPAYEETYDRFGNGSQQRSAVVEQPGATSELIPNAAPQVTGPLP